MQTPKRHPSFKTLICKAIRNINPNNRVFITPKRIMYFINRCNYEINFNRKLSKFFFKRAFMELVSAKILEKGPNNHSYRITPKLKLSKIKLNQLHNPPSIQESSKKIRKRTPSNRRGAGRRATRGTRGGSRGRGRGTSNTKRGDAAGRSGSKSVATRSRGRREGTVAGRSRGRGRTAGVSRTRAASKRNEAGTAKRSAVRRTGSSRHPRALPQSPEKNARAGTRRSVTLARRTQNQAVPPIRKAIRKKPGPSPRSSGRAGRPPASRSSARVQRRRPATIRGTANRARRGRNTASSVIPSVVAQLFAPPIAPQPSIAIPLPAVASNKEEERNLPIWQFYDQNNVSVEVQNASGWYDYDKPASDVVEEEWQKYIKNRAMCDVRAVKSGAYEYAVDFMSWTQTNITHHNHKVRRVRRLDEAGNVTLNPYQN